MKNQYQRLFFVKCVLFFALLLGFAFFNCGKNDTFSSKVDLVSQLETTRGICVVLGDSTGEIAIDLARKTELLIYSQLSRAEDVARARLATDSAGFYGSRIYVEQGALNHLHLADNLADIVLAVGSATSVPRDEALRVVRPEGQILLGEKTFSKPFPEGIDDWSHPYHGPDNNPQSSDQRIRAPYLTQFLVDPRYAPLTQAAVASAGRVFKAFGNVAFHEREEPYLNTLVAFNGYNGTLLWKREITAGLMLHRNILIATPDILFFGDDRSCKMIDTRTGELLDEIIPPRNLVDGTFWKWMGMENGVLYALVGAQEQKDPVMRWRRKQHGWPWSDISEGFTQPEHEWGFGKTLVAINPKSKKVIWRHREALPVDSRALCLKNGKIFLFHFGEYLTCLSARDGREIWRKTKEKHSEFFEKIGPYLRRQGFKWNWRTRNYLMASDDVIYFAGPQIDKLLAISTKDGSILWENSYNNFQLVLREEGLYGISGPWRDKASKLFNPLTGEILADVPTARRACTRPNGATDAILFRASGGTVRLDLAKNEQQWISPMRPPCQDGVTVANGMLYWWPSVCDCQLSIYGVTGVSSAGDFNFSQAASADRLEQGQSNPASGGLYQTENDWPTFRQNNHGTVTAGAQVASNGQVKWQYPPAITPYPGTNVMGHAYYPRLTAPVTADGLVWYGDSNGRIYALNSQTGALEWRAFTGGRVTFPPTVWQNRLFVGSGDGWLYCLHARSGEVIWRFRAAPVERKIPVYGNLLSTWPVASGALVAEGVVYFAAGIMNYDGTHVYALDAETGEIKWQNNTSGHLEPGARTGVGVQGHLLLVDDKLYLASGTSVSPAIFDARTGDCLNDPEPLKNASSSSPRGWELFKLGDQVAVSGKPFYSHPQYPVFDPSVTNKMLVANQGNRDVLWINNEKIQCVPRLNQTVLANSVVGNRFSGYRLPNWGRYRLPDEPFWEYNCVGSNALAVTENAVVVGEPTKLVVLSLQTGTVLWSVPLPAEPVPWGIAVGRDGQIFVTTKSGFVVCAGGESTKSQPYVNSGLYFVDSTRVELGATGPGEIRYTTDGSDPTITSPKYTRPISVNQSTRLTMRTFRAGKPESFAVIRDLQELEYWPPVQMDSLKPGLAYEYREGVFLIASDLKKKQPIDRGIKERFDFTRTGFDSEEFGFTFRGVLKVPQNGIYTFYLLSNDGSILYLNDREFINNDGDHRAIEKQGTLALQAGYYPILLDYFQSGGGKALKLSWEGPGIPRQEIAGRFLFHQPGKSF